MKKFILGTATLAAIGMAAVGPAQVRETPLDANPNGLTLRLGAGLPLDDELKDIEDIFIGFGIQGNASPFIRGSETFFSVDAFFTGSGGNSGTDFFPIAINQRFYTGGGGYGNRTYAFGGLGVTIMGSGRTTTVFSGRIGIGKELSDHVIAEATFYTGNESNGVSPTFLGVFVGYKF